MLPSGPGSGIKWEKKFSLGENRGIGSDTNTLNLTDDKLELLFGSEVEGKY